MVAKPEKTENDDNSSTQECRCETPGCERRAVRQCLKHDLARRMCDEHECDLCWDRQYDEGVAKRRFLRTWSTHDADFAPQNFALWGALIPLVFFMMLSLSGDFLEMIPVRSSEALIAGWIGGACYYGLVAWKTAAAKEELVVKLLADYRYGQDF